MKFDAFIFDFIFWGFRGIGMAFVGEIAKAALDLSPEDRLELARTPVESVVTPDSEEDAVREGIKRIEDIAQGRISGLTEEEFRRALG